MNNNIIFVNQNKQNKFSACIIINGQHYASYIRGFTDTKKEMLKTCKEEIKEFCKYYKVKLSIKDFFIVENKQEVFVFSYE